MEGGGRNVHDTNVQLILKIFWNGIYIHVFEIILNIINSNSSKRIKRLQINEFLLKVFNTQ